MSAGTLTLTNNSAIASGADTAFSRDLVSGDFVVVVVGGITYTLPVQSVDSDQQVTLIRKYEGPTQSGLAWYAVPRATQNQITAEAVTQATETLRVFNLDKRNWQAVFSESGDITVILPDKSMFSGPSWRKIVEILGKIDIEGVTELADQVRADALQVETDKQAAQSAAESASTDRSAAESANSSAQTAKSDAETAADTATDKATESRNAAEDAQTAKAAAELAAATVQPENLLQNANNLDDLTNKPAARQNLDVFSREEIADMLPGFLGQIDWQEMRTALEPGTAPRDGQEVDQTGIFAELYSKALAGKLPTCTEAEWQADPLNRGCYVLESSPGKMRLPDDNGVQLGSLKIPVHVGDGGDSSVNGRMGASALPNLKFQMNTRTLSTAGGNGTVYAGDGLGVEVTNRGSSLPGISPTSVGSGTVVMDLVDIDASRYNDIYKDGVTEVRVNRMQGCWTVRFAAKATNGGSIDALALASAIAAGDAELLAKIIATNDRIDYALIAPEAEMVKNTRALYENPFGNDVPVICLAEFYHPTLAKWVSSSCVWTASNSGYGLRAAYAAGEGISLSAMPTGFALANNGNGASQAVPANYTANALVRIHVWKVAVSS